MISSIPRLEQTALAAGIVLSAVCMTFLGAEAAPCIDTHSGDLVDRTMAIRWPGGGEIEVTGGITFLDPVTREIGVSVLGLDGEQRIAPAAIRFAALEPSENAQMSLPVKTSLGPFSSEFSYADVTINDGIIRYPLCTDAADGHETAFIGNLTFGASKLKVDGTFVDYARRPADNGKLRIIRKKRG